MKNNNIYELIQASYATNILYALTKNHVFDSLSSEAKSLESIAALCGLKKEILEDFLSAAVALNFLKLNNQNYSNARKGFLLTEQVDSWFRAYLLLWGEQLNPTFSHLETYLKSGENPFKIAHGETIWDFYNIDGVQSELFVEFMSKVTQQSHIPAILKELDVGSAHSIVDIGGGKGALVCSLLKQHAQLTGVIFDQPSNSRKATQNIKVFDLEDKCRFIGGNVFDHVPSNHDLYTIKHVLHDWDDDNVVRILSSISNAMRPDSTLVMIEGLMDRSFDSSIRNPEFMHTRNIEQKVWTSGKVRNSAEFEKLSKLAKLNILKITHSSIFDMSYIYCQKSDQSGRLQ